MGAAADEQFCLRWNDFQQCIKSTFQELRDENDFMDVTISCDGEQVKAHKVILSACSITFKTLLKKNPAQHPVIVLWDVSPRDLAAILDFMYHGEVNVKQDNLNSFLAVAERLRVRGLCQNDKQGGSSSEQTTTNSTKFVSTERSKSRDSTATTFSEPIAKKPRISSPPPPTRQDDDDIEELPQPIVKQEVSDHHVTPTVPQVPRPRPTAVNTVAQYEQPEPVPVDPTGRGGYQLAEQEYEGGEGDYADYSGYEDDGMGGGGYMEGGVMMDQGQAKAEECHSCEHCGKVYKSVSSLRNHKSIYHRKNKSDSFRHPPGQHY